MTARTTAGPSTQSTTLSAAVGRARGGRRRRSRAERVGEHDANDAAVRDDGDGLSVVPLADLGDRGQDAAAEVGEGLAAGEATVVGLSIHSR